MFSTVSKSTLLKGFIFTLVWAFDEQADWNYVEDLRKCFNENNWTFYVVELYAPGLQTKQTKYQ
jgi:hypothetical protein